MPDLVGKLPPAPVLGLVEDGIGAAKPLDDLLDLRVQIGDLLVRRIGCDEVDELGTVCLRSLTLLVD